MTRINSTCYACSRSPTSSEHVPPRCLFPKPGDVDGRDRRLNLITVPSCEDHNMLKSRDDEFLMVSIAGIIGNNSIGFRYRLGKVDRAIRRSSRRLLDCAFRNRQHVVLGNLDDNRFVEAIWGTPDHDRLIACFSLIARGIYYHEHKTRFLGDVKVMLGYISHPDPSSREFSRFIEDRIGLELTKKAKLGQNPDVFYYQITDRDDMGLSATSLIFYGGVRVYAALIPEGVDLGKSMISRLMDTKVTTMLTLGGKIYRIS